MYIIVASVIYSADIPSFLLLLECIVNLILIFKRKQLVEQNRRKTFMHRIVSCVKEQYILGEVERRVYQQNK